MGDQRGTGVMGDVDGKGVIGQPDKKEGSESEDGTKVTDRASRWQPVPGGGGGGMGIIGAGVYAAAPDQDEKHSGGRKEQDVAGRPVEAAVGNRKGAACGRRLRAGTRSSSRARVGGRSRPSTRARQLAGGLKARPIPATHRHWGAPAPDRAEAELENARKVIEARDTTSSTGTPRLVG
jgi:hypothetical protein